MIPDGDYVLRVPSWDDWSSINDHGWGLSQGETSVSGTAYEQLQFTVRDCKVTPGAVTNFLDSPPVGFPYTGYDIFNILGNAQVMGPKLLSVLNPALVATVSSGSRSSLSLDSMLLVAGVVAGLVVGKLVLPKFKAAYEPIADASLHNSSLRA